MEYQSPFEDWYTYSTVHKPLPDFTCEAGLMLFPPELVPGVGHPLVDRLGRHATRRLTMRKLESYNAFTEKLEYQAVMAASIKLAQHPQAFGLSEQAGREARLIVTDESHHAYVAVELMKRLPDASDLPPLTPSQPRFLRGLEEFGRGLPAQFADDLLIAFVSISETLITSILRGVPRDPRVRECRAQHGARPLHRRGQTSLLFCLCCAPALGLEHARSEGDARASLCKADKAVSRSGPRSVPGLASGSWARRTRRGDPSAGLLFARTNSRKQSRRRFPDTQAHAARRYPGSSDGACRVRGTEAYRLAGRYGAGGSAQLSRLMPRNIEGRRPNHYAYGSSAACRI